MAELKNYYQLTVEELEVLPMYMDSATQDNIQLIKGFGQNLFEENRIGEWLAN